jgi:hypothetical protein
MPEDRRGGAEPTEVGEQKAAPEKVPEPSATALGQHIEHLVIWRKMLEHELIGARPHDYYRINKEIKQIDREIKRKKHEFIMAQIQEWL